MKKFLFSLLILSAAQVGFSQNTTEYARLNKEGDSLFMKLNFKDAAFTFSRALEANRWVGTAADHYILGETYSVSEMIDSSISNLQKAVALGYKDYSFLMGDVLLKNAKRDARWREIEAGVRKNKRIADAKIDQKLAAQLKTMAEKDQELRRTIPKLITLKGPKDPEVLEIRSKLRAMDSVNILIVSKVLDEKGWLGADVVSDTGASCILLVVQHMPLSMQEKYLPMMREAVKNGKAQTTDLALLEDGVLVRQGKKQIYGTQVTRTPQGEMRVQPIEDEANVDKRRAAVGLAPMKDYLRFYGIDYQSVNK